MGAQKADPKAPNYDPDTDHTVWGSDHVHPVTLGPFMIGKHEVTQEQWEAAMASRPSEFTGDQRPVESVSWDELHADDGFLERKLEGGCARAHSWPWSCGSLPGSLSC